MAITEQERALLRLLLTSGQTYDQVGSVLGVEAKEVQARARAVLTKLGGEDPDADVALTEYLLGQAAPAEREPVERYLAANPSAEALARRLEAQLGLIAPAATAGAQPVPTEATIAAAPPREAAQPDTQAPSVRFGWLPQRWRLIAGAAGAIVIAVAVVLLVTGTFGDDDGGEGEVARFDPRETATLRPPEGTVGGLGKATFGRTEGAPTMLISLTGLEPAPEGKTYAVWLLGERGEGVAVGGQQVDEQGQATGLASLPESLVPHILTDRLDTVRISLISNAALRAAQAETAREPTAFTRYVGKTVLTGSIEEPTPGTSTG